MRRLRFAAVTACTLAAVAACRDADPTEPGATARAQPAAVSYATLTGGSYWEAFTLAPNPRVGDATGALVWLSHPPTAWRPTDFDVAIHSRDRATWYTPEGFRAMHGTGCQPFQADEPANTVRAGDDGSHRVAAYDDMNYRCRNHMMTALNSAGYGVIYVTPNAMIDWSEGEASIKFALSTLRTSGRDWVDLWITPWEDNLAVPLDGDLPDMQGPPRHAIHVRMTAELNRSAFEAYVVDRFEERRLPVVTREGYESILTPVSTRRDTFELRISATRLRFGMTKLASPDGPAGAMTWVDASYPALGWTRGVVQFGHHSFNPALAANPALPAGTGGTWHWDDFQLSRAVPFTIVTPAAGAQRFADASRPAVTFAAPSPGGGFLRFAASTDRIEVSADGRPWIKARLQAEALDTPGRFHSFWTSLPTGTTTVRFRAAGPAGGDEWLVRDPAIWSRAASAGGG